MMGRAPLESVALYARELGLSQSPADLMRERDRRVLEIIRKGVEPMPGLREILESLRPRFKLAIATSARAEFAEMIIGGLGLRDYFAVLQTSDDITRGKPDPEIYLLAMSKLAVEPVNCCVLEDSSNGALAGKRAGAYVIAVPSQYTRSQDFSFVDDIAADLFDAKNRSVNSALRS